VAVTSQFVFTSHLRKPISRFDRITGTFIDSIGQVGPADGQFTDCRGLAVDEKRDWLFATDFNRNCVLRFRASSGQFDCEFGSKGDGDGQLHSPFGIRVCGDSLWVADRNNKR